jgi:hypothetical protein
MVFCESGIRFASGVHANLRVNIHMDIRMVAGVPPIIVLVGVIVVIPVVAVIPSIIMMIVMPIEASG